MFAAGVACTVALIGSTARASVNVWTSNGPYGITSVTALALDPHNPGTVYAGTDGDGVFRSTDGGGSWGTVNAGLGSLYVSALIIDPNTPSTLYAGTTPRPLSGGGGGVFQSTNSGASWSAVNTGLIGTGVHALAIDPDTPRTLYSAPFGWIPFAGWRGRGVFKSTDGGSSWTEVNTGLTIHGVYALAIDPLVSATLYAGASSCVCGRVCSCSGGVFKSDDGAGTWSAVHTGPNLNVHVLAIDPLTPTTLYAGMVRSHQPAGESGGGVAKSTDGGSTWMGVNTGLTDLDVYALAIDPVTPTTVYSGTSGGGVFKSTDGGNSWSAFSAGLSNLDVPALAIDPITPSRLYAGTAGGGVFAIDQVSSCVGDCTGNRQVSVDELLTMVNIALGTAMVSGCLAGDGNQDGAVTVDEILTAVNNSLNGCPVPPTPKPTQTPTRTPTIPTSTITPTVPPPPTFTPTRPTATRTPPASRTPTATRTPNLPRTPKSTPTRTPTKTPTPTRTPSVPRTPTGAS
jgi:photosystem II stability/assembly factor-like uncharacterized protein